MLQNYTACTLKVNLAFIATSKELTIANPDKTNFVEGTIQPGSDADFVIWRKPSDRKASVITVKNVSSLSSLLLIPLGFFLSRLLTEPFSFLFRDTASLSLRLHTV